MAVVIETTLGDFTVDLFTDSRPQACKNFLKLCKMKYYHFCLFHSVQPNFLAQTGDPLGTGSGGESIYGLLYGDNARYFEAEVMPKIKHYKPGLLSMVNCGNNMLGSQFFITLGEDLVSLDGEHCVFGEITEGTEIIHKLNEAICDTLHRPYKDIRITHTVILEDPFEDPSGLKAPDTSPEPTQEKLANGRIGADEEIDETAGLTAAEVEERRQEREAKARATILEIVGDLPDADVAPPENVLFVCKLNPVTTDEDLEIIFNRFGKVMSCEVIRDKNTGDSLQYAFVEFDDQKACEEAYFKMDNVLIDDRRIHVDFSQSTAKERNIRWRGKGKGIEYLDQQDRVKDSKLRDKSREESRNHSSSSNRRDKDHAERDRHKERIREREDERQTKGERGREKDGDSRERRRRERDRSRSDYRKRDGKHRRDNHRDDNKRYDKRRETENIRKRESDLKKSSGGGSSRKSDKRSEDRRDDDCKREDKRLKKEVSSGNRHTDFDKIENLEKLDFKEKKLCRNLTTGQICKEESDLKSSQKTNESNQQMPCVISQPQNVKIGITDDQEFPESSEVNKRLIEEEEGDKKEQIESDHSTEDKISHKSDKTNDEQRLELKKRSSKRKRKVSQNRKRKKGRYSSSSESSSDSSDSSESSSSSDSSDYKHSKKKKLIIAKKYYRGGKLVKEVKKKKRTKVSSDSDSISDESSDSEHKKKRKLKKQKKSSNHVKPPRKSVTSSDDSHSETSSSDSSDVRNKKSKRKSCEKQIKKKSKHSSSKKRKRRKEASSSSDSDISVKNKAVSKK